MPQVPSVFSASTFSLRQSMFGVAVATASMVSVPLKTSLTPATGGTLAIVGYNMPFSGSLVAVSWSWSSALTAGTFSLTPTINGAAITNAGLLLNALPFSAANAQYGLLKIDGQSANARWISPAYGSVPNRIGVNLTTSAGITWAGTSDLQIELLVLYDGVLL